MKINNNKIKLINELDKINNELIVLKKTFNTQFNDITFDLKSLHEKLITLSTEFPEHKNLIEFIIFINDRIEIKQTHMKDVLTDTFNELIKVKQEILNQHKEMVTSKESITDKIFTSIDGKWLLVGFIVIFVLTLAVFVPDTMIKIIDLFFSKGSSVLPTSTN